MKDKSRFISSVIVSLLAGFIYYQFGENINEKLQNSFKAVLSSNDDMEIYLRADCQSFNSLTSNDRKSSSKKNSKFFMKRKNTVEFGKNRVTVPGDEMFTEFVKASARVVKPSPDKNINFTAELNRLLKGNNNKPVAGKELRINKRFNSPKEDVADANYKAKTLIHKDEANVLGNGFEYNFMIEAKGVDNGKIKTQGNNKKYNSGEVNRVKIECKVNGGSGKTLEVIMPEILIRSNCNNHPGGPEAIETEVEVYESDSESGESEGETVEVDEPAESGCNDSM